MQRTSCNPCRAVSRWFCCGGDNADDPSIHELADMPPEQQIPEPSISPLSLGKNQAGSAANSTSPSSDTVRPITPRATPARSSQPLPAQAQAQAQAPTALDRASEPLSGPALMGTGDLTASYRNYSYAQSLMATQPETERFPDLPALNTAGLGVNADTQSRRHSTNDLDYNHIRSYQRKGIAGPTRDDDEITPAGPISLPHFSITGTPEGASDSTRPTTAATGNAEPVVQKKSYQNDGTGMTWADHAKAAEDRGEPVYGIHGLTEDQAEKDYQRLVLDPKIAKDRERLRSDNASSKQRHGGIQETFTPSPVDGMANISDLIASTPEEAFARRSDEEAPAATKLLTAKASHLGTHETDKAELEKITRDVQGKENYSPAHESLFGDGPSNAEDDKNAKGEVRPEEKKEAPPAP